VCPRHSTPFRAEPADPGGRQSTVDSPLRASKGITGETEFIVIGSQAILGSFPDAPRELRKSIEADLYPRFKPDLAEKIEGALGRYSQFDTTFGYHADGVGPDTARLPPGWESRLVRLSNENTGGAVGWCLEPHDLAFSKLSARREKDLSFVSALLRFKMIRESRLRELIESIEDPASRESMAESFRLCRRR